VLFALAAAGAALIAFVPGPAEAQMRDVLIRFMPPAEAVDGYRIFVFDQQDLIEAEVDTGYIPADPDGIGRISMALDASHSYVVEMSAYNAEGESSRSNALAIPAEACDAAFCEDGNPCTVDSCDAQGACISDFQTDGVACDDSFSDTINDVCISGVCSGEILVCSANSDCSDDDVCNGIESCDGGVECLAGPALDCGAPTQCTIPRCDPVQGCLTEVALDGTACDDGRLDTVNDTCVAGSCSGEVLVCSANSDCSDGNVCNGIESCDGGLECLAGTPLACGAPTQCTTSLCDPVQGCLSINVPDGARCEDGRIDTLNDVCMAGTCSGEVFVCSANSDCSDGDVCNGIESCNGGMECLSGAPLQCGAPTQCTSPRCDPVLGCQSDIAPDGTACDDAQANTTGDACMAGVCVGSEATDEDALRIDYVSPGSLPAGRAALTVVGGGFTQKPKVFFENGNGRKPKIRFVNVIEESTVVVGIKVRTRGLTTPTTWDLRLKMPDGREVAVPGVLTVTPD
jgi:hypothetical protein